MAFWSKWFSSPASGAEQPSKVLDYKGYVIEARPYKDGSQWQLAGRITKDDKVHEFVRADKFASKDEAAEFAIAKGQLVVDQSGDGMFK